MAVCQNLVPLVNIKIAGKWMFIPLKLVLIGIDPYSYFPVKNENLSLPAGTEKSNITAVFRELLKTSGVTERAEQRKDATAAPWCWEYESQYLPEENHPVM
jgi:hypothetical protein